MQFPLGVVLSTVLVEPNLLLLRVLCDPVATNGFFNLLEFEMIGCIILTAGSTSLAASIVHFSDGAHGNTAFFLVPDLFAVLLRISVVSQTAIGKVSVVDAVRQNLG